MNHALATLAAVAVAAAIAGAGVVGLGLYDVSATDQHLAPTYWVLDTSLRQSIARRGRDVVPPPLLDDRMRKRGADLFDRHCVPCHGGPGVPPEPFALGLTPAAASLVHKAREWDAGSLYWVIRHGIKMTGMPAWEHRLADDELWAIVAFLQDLPHLRPVDYWALVGRDAHGSRRGHAGFAQTDAEEDRLSPAHGMPHPATRAGDPGGGTASAARSTRVSTSAGDPARGKRAIEQYACVTCHAIPGIVGDNAPVGPPLRGIGRRKYLAGMLENTPANMVRWIRHPHAVSPGSAMPDLGVTERHAVDMAAYLRTLD